MHQVAFSQIHTSRLSLLNVCLKVCALMSPPTGFPYNLDFRRATTNMASEVYFHPPPHFLHLKKKKKIRKLMRMYAVSNKQMSCLTLVRPCPLKWAKTIHRKRKKIIIISESTQVQYKYAFFKESIKNIN